MTPLKGTDKEAKIIKIERYPYKKLDKNKVQHIAGGPYKGIIVHKAITGKCNFLNAVSSFDINLERNCTHSSRKIVCKSTVKSFS